jgi:TP901 family phage tail tape measure protein
MATTLEELLVRLGVSSAGLTAGLAKAEAEIKGFGDSTSKSGAKAAGGFNVVGMASLAIAGGVAAIGVESVKSASQFQSSMELIQTQAGASSAEVASMTQGILALAPTVGIGPDALAQGLYHVESAGLRGAKALENLKVAAEGAKVGHADLESVTNALIAANQSGVAGITSMAGAMGTLNAIVGAGNMRMQDLTDAMGTGVLSTAKNYGVTIQSVGAALASMTDQGIPAIDAATRLNSAMRLMAAPTSKAVKELKSIGLSSTQLATDMRSPGGMLTAITDLKTHLDKSGLSLTQQAALIAGAFGGKQSGAILTLIGNVGLLKQKTDAVAAGAGAFGAAWTATEATTAEEGAKLSASIDTISTSIGVGLLPAANQMLGTVTPIIAGMAQWAAANPGLASTILAVVGGVAALGAGVAFAGPILAGIGTVLGVIASPLTLVAAAVGGLAAHFGLFGKDAKGAVDGVVSKITTAFPPLGKILDTISTAVSGVVGWLTSLVEGFTGTTTLGDAAGVVLASLSTSAQQLAGILGGALNTAFTAVSGAVSGLVSWFTTWDTSLTGTTTLGDALSANLTTISAGLGVVSTAVSSAVTTVATFATGLVDAAAKAGIFKTAGEALKNTVGFLGDAIGVVSKAVGVVANWFTTFVTHLTGTTSATGTTTTSLSGLGDTLTTVANAIGSVVSVGVTLVAGIIDWGDKSGAFKLIGDALTIAFGLMGDTIRIVVTAMSDLAGVVSGALSAAFKAIGPMWDQMKSSIKAVSDAIGILIANAQKAVSAIGAIPGVKLGADAVGAGAGIAGALTPQGAANGVLKFLGFASGGIVPGTGPQLIVAHGGETVLPPDYLTNTTTPEQLSVGMAGISGDGGLRAALVDFTAALRQAASSGVPLHIDGQAVGDMLDKRLSTSQRVYTTLAPSTGSSR